MMENSDLTESILRRFELSLNINVHQLFLISYRRF
nr:MAG TPA: hypothetical protein [Caudoviricetes sp.]